MFELAVPIVEYVRPDGRTVIRDIVVPEHQFKWVAENNVKLSFGHNGHGLYIVYFDVGWRINDDESEDPDELIRVAPSKDGFVPIIDDAITAFTVFADRKRFNTSAQRPQRHD